LAGILPSRDFQFSDDSKILIFKEGISMRILIGEFIEGFRVKDSNGLAGDETILLQIQLSNLNTIQRPGVNGPAISAKAVHQGFWLGTTKEDKQPEKTLEDLKKVLIRERIRFFPVYKVRHSEKSEPPTSGKIWVSSSRSSYAGNFIQLGLIFRDEKTSTFYLFRRSKGRIDFWARTEDLSEVKTYLKALDCLPLLTEAVAKKKQLLREMKQAHGTPNQRLDRQVGQVLQALTISETPKVPKGPTLPVITIKKVAAKAAKIKK
jgi:hypothetical protein